MSSERETTRIVRSWLEEGVTALPDRVLDTVLDQLPATPQRRSWWPARRSPFMKAYAKLAIAAAAVLVVVVIGYQLAPRSPGFGGMPSPTPVPTATVPQVGAPSEGPVKPGSYAWAWSDGHLVFDLPAGWTAAEGGLLLSKHADQPTAVELANWFPGSGYEVTHVYADACKSEGKLQEVGPTAADLVSALKAQLSTDATVSAGSLAGASRVDLVQAAGLDRSTCRHGATGPLQIWADPAETNYFALAPGYTGFAYVVDVRGSRLVFTGAAGGEASAADIVELDAILGSLRIQP
jgi:hypothetical protein